jgi:adenine-specific DNA-methyltransferase
MKNPKSDRPLYDPGNPHPLSRISTELVWEGKYDEYGNRRPIHLPTSPLPLQRIETIDEPHDREKAHQLSMFDEAGFHQKAHRDDFRNMLIWGDNKLVMTALFDQYRGKVDFIYIDPPFDVGADFSMEVQLGDEGDQLQKEQSILEAVAYSDTWGQGTDSYLNMMYERLVMMRDLLTETGSMCVHCDWHASQYLKILLFEVFGSQNYRNEIVWWYYNKMQGNVGQFAANHDVILWFSKSSSFNYHPIRELRETPKRQQKRVWDPETNSLKQARDENGDLVYYTETERTLDDVWRIPYLMPADLTENQKYRTQKPIELVGRIIDAFTNEDDLILDAFCGSGTTLVAAEGLRVKRQDTQKEFYFSHPRKWIGIDLGRYSIHLTRKRLIGLQRNLYENERPYRSFDVYNLGRYERQWWQLDRLKGADVEHRNIVLKFYKAISLDNPPNSLLHGKKAGAYVHVAKIDSIFTYPELCDVTLAAQASGGRELHCLAWEFEMELALKKSSIEAETGVTVRLKYIPREIMEPNRSECQFFEAGYLEARVIEPQWTPQKELIAMARKQPRLTTQKIDVELVRFIPALAEAPESEINELRERAVNSPFDFIDFWAVDFDYQEGQPFEHHWQDFRTRKDRSLKIKTDLGWTYAEKGKHSICVKVIDVFGVDTTTVISLEV